MPIMFGIILIETQKGENTMTMFKFKDGKLTINIQEIADKATEGAIIAKKKATEGAVIAKKKATEGAVIAKKKATEALQYTNEKLKDRAIRIVAQIANTTHAKAFEVLQNCNWEVKTAVVSICFNTDIETARQKLKRHSGVLRKVLSEKDTVK